MKTILACGLMALGLAFLSPSAFACASADDPPPPADAVGGVQRFAGTQSDCIVSSDPKLGRIQLDQILKDKDSRDHAIGLRGSRKYRLIIACEDACTSMNVTVTNAATGAKLGEASGPGQPAVEFELADTTQIMAVARMDACPKEDGCRYGVGVYTIGQAKAAG